MRFERAVALLCVVAVVGLAVLANQTASSRSIRVLLATPLPTPVHTHGLVYTSYVPPGRIYKLYPCQAYDPHCLTTKNLIESPTCGFYGCEGSLVGNNTATNDNDYMLPGVSVNVYLPGKSWDAYSYDGAQYIPGSGWVEEWTAPNGGRFAFLHMQQVYTPHSNSLSVNLQGESAPHKYRGIDETVLIARALLRGGSHRATGIVYYGGALVGRSGWPDWPQYSNGGSGGQGDAHLCVVTDRLGSLWGYHVVFQPTPRPFDVGRWREYTRSKGLRPISQYEQNTTRLSWAASFWKRHEWLYGVKGHGRYYGNASTGYMRTPFRKGAIYCFPGYHRCKAAGK